ncbi:CBO0543 family protein [Bacillus sp. Marseille-P3661]|uniref:CBO0543 family protein n=1 Tax=Bacillus sp. Marseille-P3661 TaxID=1936234 RepID=UPI000C8486D1|nr:CBO0543 family protein [Bacillus sp. Marseille-P3661]
MKQQFEKNALRFLFVIGLISFLNLVRKPPTKDWIIIFLFKGFLSSILDNLVVSKGYIKYPVKIFKTFDISFIFDYLLYPVTCIYYNQITKNSTIPGIFMKTFYFSIPMTLIEYFLEKKTQLINFKKGWTIKTSFYSLTVTFLISRTFIAIIRKANNKPVPEN